MSTTQEVELAVRPSVALKRVAEHSERWGGAWDAHDAHSGKLGLPVIAGIRRGWVEGDVQVESCAAGSKVRFEQDHSAYTVDRGSLMILVAAAIGCLFSLLAIFFPKLLPLMPVGILLAMGAYLVVIARLRNSGPEEFFESLAEEDE